MDVKFFTRHIDMLPHHYTQSDSNRMVLSYFCIASLDLLGVLETATTAEQRAGWTEWIYAQQVHPSQDFPEEMGLCGFRGSPIVGSPFNPTDSTPIHKHDSAHITMTYTALVLLLTLGDPLKRVNRTAIIKSLCRLQHDDGSFSPNVGNSERDMRFLYCACAISYLLDDWSGVDVGKAVGYINASRSYDFGYAQGPGEESHGGSTYCAIASLWLMGELKQPLVDKDRTLEWLIGRQVSGFQGRINKPPDTCYAFWIGASLKLLDSYESVVNRDALYEFLSLTQSKVGGYSKVPGVHPDVLHSYFGLAGRAIAGDKDLQPIVASVGMTQSSFDKWKQLKQFYLK